MRGALLLLLLGLVVAGCAAPGHGSDAPAGPRADTSLPATGPPAPAFAAPAVLRGAGGPEPVIAIADDGTRYVAAQDANGRAPHVWVSGDGGRSWATSSPSAQSGGEVDLATGPRGMVFLTQLGPQGNVVSVSRDHGRTWSASPLAALTQSFDRELIAVDAAGSAYIVARQFGGGAAAVASRSDNGGITFLRQGTAWDLVHEPGSANGNLLATGQGLLLAYVCRDAGAVCLARSNDRGVSWTQSLVAARSASVDNVYPVVAADGGQVVVVWSDAAQGRLAVWGAASSDGGATWSDARQLSSASESATLPWAASGGGVTWVAYVATPDDLAASDQSEAAQSAWTVVTARLDTPSLEVAERGAAMDAPVHEGAISKPLSRADGAYDRRFGDFFTLAVGRDGRASIAVPQTTQGATQDLVLAQA